MYPPVPIRTAAAEGVNVDVQSATALTLAGLLAQAAEPEADTGAGLPGGFSRHRMPPLLPPFLKVL